MGWSDLPVELEEVVLSFLPVPDLCRCRAVCKAWDHVISTPYFRTLAFKNARTGLGYIIARVVLEEQRGIGPKFHGWSILDLETRRWYRITHEYSKLDKADLPRVATYGRYNGCVNTDGGLVCELVSWNYLSQRVVSIYNPLMRKRMMRLPDMPDHKATCFVQGWMKIISHDDDDNFSVFWIKNGIAPDDEDGELHIVLVYESRTGQWRSVTNPSLPTVDHPGFCYMESLCVVFQGLLYVVFGWSLLCRYNVVEDLWEDTGVGMAFQDLEICVDYSMPQLIESDNRLFLLAWVYVIEEEHPLFCAYEVLLADKSLQVVFQMTVTQMRLQFGFRSSGVTGNRSKFFRGRYAFTTEWMGDMQDSWCPGCTKAFGFGKSLLVMLPDTGISIVYNLVSRSWDRMPTNPMHPLPQDCRLWYAATNAIHLRLPSGEREGSP